MPADFHGQQVSKISGESVIVTINLSGLSVEIASGDLIRAEISGDRVEAHVMSGSVTVNSGFVSIGDPIGGFASINAYNNDSNAEAANMLETMANMLALDAYPTPEVRNRLRVNLSGQGALTVATSGSEHVIVQGSVSGAPILQAGSGWGWSGGAYGHIGVAGMVAGVAPTLQSGTVSPLILNTLGQLRVTAQVSGIIGVSGRFGISSGTISIQSGLIGVSSGEVHITSGVVSSSGDIHQIAGNSGIVAPQLQSGWAHSGAELWTDGAIGTFPAFVDGVAPIRQSGTPSLLSITGSGSLRVVVINPMISGRVAVTSGEMHITSGLVAVESGTIVVTDSANTPITISLSRVMVTVSGDAVEAHITSGGLTMLSGGFFIGRMGVRVDSGQVMISSGSVSISSGSITINSGIVGAQVSGAVQVSGTVAVSGKVFAKGMSGIDIWQDSSGVVGVTILSGNITTTANISGQAVLVAGNSGFLVPQTLSGWAHSGVVFGHLGVAGLVTPVVPTYQSGQMAGLTLDANGLLRVTTAAGGGGQISGTVAVSGIVGVSGRVDVTSGEIHILSGAITIISGGVFVSGTVSILGGTQVSGTVAVSGGVIVSGVVNVAGNSGHLVPQSLSGWGHSGAQFGHLGVAGVVTPIVPTFTSGQHAPLTLNSVGEQRVTSQISGAVQVSGTIAISGLVGVHSGLVGITSGVISILSGAVVIISGGVFVSGTVTVFSGSTVQNMPVRPTTGNSRKIQPITAASGGEVLLSGTACVSVTVRYLKQAGSGTNGASGIIFIGYDATSQQPVAISGFNNSSWGFALYPGDGITVAVSGSSILRACATLSGDSLSIIHAVY